MKNIENLREIAESQLHGLRATPKMLGEIKRSAASWDGRNPAGTRVGLRTATLVIGAVLLLGVGIVTRQGGDILQEEAPAISASMLDSQPAGGGYTADENPTERALLDIPPGRISLGAEQTEYHNLFAKGTGSNFPLVSVDGATYRMMQNPSSISESLLGSTWGQVTEYTTEPALSRGGIVSNAVLQGETVYAVRGMDGAMAAARVDGNLRVFQRVSFAGSAIIGNESLRDTLCDPRDVAAMELSEAGTVGDAASARELMRTLLENAVYQSASVSSGGTRSLLIHLQNGLTLQLMAGEDTVSACGTWSCPEFFEEFAAIIS
ncbi:MAG: hypothetical protein FWF86_01895 [Clostridia bacterium]|nr:hypothetical protein [Clostridia bacterium]